MKGHRADHAVATMCRLLEVSESGYYAWLERTPSARSLADQALQAKIEAIHEGSGETAGFPESMPS